MIHTPVFGTVPLGDPAGGGGRRLGLLLLRLPDFFFLTSVSFGHIELLVNVEHQLRWFDQLLQVKTLPGFRPRSSIPMRWSQVALFFRPCFDPFQQLLRRFIGGILGDEFAGEGAGEDRGTPPVVRGARE